MICRDKLRRRTREQRRLKSFRRAPERKALPLKVVLFLAFTAASAATERPDLSPARPGVTDIAAQPRWTNSPLLSAPWTSPERSCTVGVCGPRVCCKERGEVGNRHGAVRCQLYRNMNMNTECCFPCCGLLCALLGKEGHFAAVSRTDHIGYDV